LFRTCDRPVVVFLERNALDSFQNFSARDFFYPLSRSVACPGSRRLLFSSLLSAFSPSFPSVGLASVNAHLFSYSPSLRFLFFFYVSCLPTSFLVKSSPLNSLSPSAFQKRKAARFRPLLNGDFAGLLFPCYKAFFFFHDGNWVARWFFSILPQRNMATPIPCTLRAKTSSASFVRPTFLPPSLFEIVFDIAFFF